MYLPALLSLLTIFALAVIFTPLSYAQSDLSLGIANYYSIKDGDAKDGDIIASRPDGYYLASSDYIDQNLIGVVSENAAITLNTGADNGKPVVSSGKVYVNVIGTNGGINKGDFITIGQTPGKGVKVTKSGFVIGKANQNFQPANPDQTGRIEVTLGVQYFVSQNQVAPSLRDILNLSALAATEQPSVVFKYLVAAIILLISISFAFFFFGKLALQGVESLGRNPRAGHIIQIGIFLNVLISIGIIGGGIIIGYLILRI